MSTGTITSLAPKTVPEDMTGLVTIFGPEIPIPGGEGDRLDFVIGLDADRVCFQGTAKELAHLFRGYARALETLHKEITEDYLVIERRFGPVS